MQNRPKIGLALGAGGGRGMAHIGVLQVLEENNIPVDMVSGCSIGALIAAIYAAGTDLYMLEKFVYTLLPKDIIDPTVPTRGGVLSGSKVEELVRVLSHDKSFGETRIPCYISAANLISGELDLFTEGKLYKAARASMAIPGVFTPVQLNGSWYVDGGTLEELPLRVLREHGADKVIAVDLSIKAHFPTGTGNPSAYGSLLRAFDMMQEEISRLKKDTVDVRIRPDVSFMGMVSTGGAERAVQVGRACTEAALPEIRRLLDE